MVVGEGYRDEVPSRGILVAGEVVVQQPCRILVLRCHQLLHGRMMAHLEQQTLASIVDFYVRHSNQGWYAMGPLAEGVPRIPVGEGGLEPEASDTGIPGTWYGLGIQQIHTEPVLHTLAVVLHMLPVPVEWVLRGGDIDLQFVLGSCHSS